MTEPCTTFTAQEVDRFGVRVTVTISVPIDAQWKHTRECAEYAQMAASRTMSQLTKSREAVMEQPF